MYEVTMIEYGDAALFILPNGRELGVAISIEHRDRVVIFDMTWERRQVHAQIDPDGDIWVVAEENA